MHRGDAVRPTRRQVLIGGLSVVAAAALAGSAEAFDWFGGRHEAADTAPLSERAIFGVSHALSDTAPVNGSLHQLETELRYVFPVVGMYITFDSSWSLAKHPSIKALGSSGRTVMVAWMPKSNSGSVELASIASGKYDSYLDQVLRTMRQYPGPVVVRFGHEMNGGWYPWSVSYTKAGLSRGACHSPAEFVSAWRHVVARERALPGPSNIRWFWCANAADQGVPRGTGSSPGSPAVALEDYWPGQQWVDIVGADGYNEPKDWTSFEDVFASAYRRTTSLAPGAPFWVGETGCHEPLPGQHGTKATWLHDMFASRQFPRAQAVCYFDYDATSSGRANWSFDSSPASLQAARQDYGATKPRQYTL